MTLYSLDGQAPHLPDGFCFVADNASLIGKVALGVDVGIWFGAVLRGDIETISVGEGSNVQDNAVLHTDAGLPLSIGRYCTIGHSAIVHGCTIGDNTLIGMGATILNGAVIGRNCLVGANALVTEGKHIPDNSLVVGAPAKVLRSIDDEGERSLRQSAERYIANARRFARGLAVHQGEGAFTPE